jgi:hypothetical protein
MFEAICKLGLEGLVKESRCAVSLWPVQKLDQDQKPKGSGGDAGYRGGF